MPSNTITRTYIMKKTILATLTLLAPLMFAQVTMANDQQAAAPSVQSTASQEMTKSEIMETAEDYQVSQTERHQPRRSALFAQILDVAAKQSTLAGL